MNETQRNGRRDTGAVVRRDLYAAHPQHHCRMGTIENYDPTLDARADELEALRCLSYLLRHDLTQPERVCEYLDQVDQVLDRMVNELKESA